MHVWYNTLCHYAMLLVKLRTVNCFIHEFWLATLAMSPSVMHQMYMTDLSGDFGVHLCIYWVLYIYIYYIH